MTPEEVDRIMRINVQGDAMGHSGRGEKIYRPQAKRQIINACSIAGHDGFALLGIYSATKFAVRALTQGGSERVRQPRDHRERLLPGDCRDRHVDRNR
ncbi:SDR family NAD(P)-dependent oxidoreductase [Raoultella ornithinolytica]|uniref:SDR family NAD(P)-dependent oxidoreductase n=1 Tax=Raoultella ornithinolytica TaxID=54291 RepID=UPI00358F4852